ncbi:MAG: LbtU family siderophore porin [Desulfobulbaceae bacterium]|nr:LbtU family siderophore porin [Desulfobulbaceae bacterium]
MKKVLSVVATMSALLLIGAGPSWALSSETAMLLDLLKTKGVISQNEAEEFAKTLEAKSADAAPDADERQHSVQNTADRVEQIEGKDSERGTEIANRVKLSGLIEVNAIARRAKTTDGAKTSSSDVTLATAQLNADATVNQYVNGRLTLLYEEDPADTGNNTVTLDEAVVGFTGGESLPAYVNVGRMYVPFGHFASHFISDPQTLILGETNDSAMVAGYSNEMVDLNVGALKGKVKEMGKGDKINSAVASATLSLPKDSEDGLAVSSGVSYLSNLATSNGLEAEANPFDLANPNQVATMVGGVSAFLSLDYADRFFFDAEYLGALRDFAVGDLNFVDTNNRKPQAWNFEVAARLTEETEFALRYGGSKDALKSQDDAFILADHEYGAALLYEIFDNTSLTAEYLFQKYQDDSNNNQATLQVAVEF